MVGVDDLVPFSTELGYLGILLISFVGSLVVFVPIPYFQVILAAALSTKFDPRMISITSALGTVITKTIIFFASYYGRSMMRTNTVKRMLPFQLLLSGYGWPSAFVASATTIPDDIVSTSRSALRATALGSSRCPRLPVKWPRTRPLCGTGSISAGRLQRTSFQARTATCSS